MTEVRPPRSASRIAPKTLGLSNFGQQSQSMAPSTRTRATERPSPIMPCASMGSSAAEVDSLKTKGFESRLAAL
ncbi:MAG: hypothetical protein R3B70_19565 [Polyangiaceae bacterium]